MGEWRWNIVTKGARGGGKDLLSLQKLVHFIIKSYLRQFIENHFGSKYLKNSNQNYLTNNKTKC
jgi:hypothetical protein